MLYGFEQQYARTLQALARDRLSGAGSIASGARKPNSSAVIYLVEGTIPAATWSTSLTPGEAMCKLLRLNQETGEIEHQKDSEDNDVEVKVYNVTESEVMGELPATIQCYMDRWGMLMATTGGAGSGTYVCKATVAITGRSGTTQGAGTVQKQKLTGGTSGTLEDDPDVPPVTVFNSYTASISVGEYILVARDEAGNWWTEPPPTSSALCDSFKALPVASGSEVLDIEYIMGVKDTGECFRVPVGDCDTMTEHS